jgi:hypothetical protein
MKTFDDIEVRRPALAKTYLQLLRAQPGRPIALFAPRRVGKTFFLDRDLAPAAKRAGLRPVYADLWLQRSAPLLAINHALEEALDDIEVPRRRAGKIAKTPVKKLGAFGAHLEMGDSPKRRALPQQAELRLDSLVSRVASAGGAQILLMLDEIQTLAQGPGGRDLVATIRAVLQKRHSEVVAVFTGSSQEELAALVAAAGAPMYQFAQLLDFPVLGEEFLHALAEHFSNVHRGKKLSLAALSTTFAKLGFKPALMKDLVKAMSAEGSTDVDEALKRFMADERHIASWSGLLASLQPFERAVLLVVAKGQAPLSSDSLRLLADARHSNPTLAKVRVALNKLRAAGILTKSMGARYAVADQLFAAYVAKLAFKEVS